MEPWLLIVLGKLWIVWWSVTEWLIFKASNIACIIPYNSTTQKSWILNKKCVVAAMNQTLILNQDTWCLSCSISRRCCRSFPRLTISACRFPRVNRIPFSFAWPQMQLVQFRWHFPWASHKEETCPGRPEELSSLHCFTAQNKRHCQH